MDLTYGNPEISEISEISPTLKSCNFFFTDPISIIFDLGKSATSNSFISVVLYESKKNKVFSDCPQS